MKLRQQQASRVGPMTGSGEGIEDDRLSASVLIYRPHYGGDSSDFDVANMVTGPEFVFKRLENKLPNACFGHYLHNQ